MRFRLVCVVALVCVVTAAGCGGSSKKATHTTAAPVTSTVASSTSSTPATPTFATAKNCAQLEALGTKFAQALQATSGSAESRISADAKAFQALASAAPSQIRDDFQTIASAFNSFASAYVKAGIKPGKTPTAAQIAQIASAVRLFSSAKVKTAEQHLTGWGRKNCGGTVTTTTG